jgi:hypothetical protein
MAKTRCELAQKLKIGNDPISGTTVRDKLTELPDYIPVDLRREKSHDFSNKRRSSVQLCQS